MRKKFFIILFILAAIGLFIFAYIVLKHNNAGAEKGQNLNAPIEIPADNIITDFAKITDEKPAVLMFYVDWCTFCRRFMPIFGQYAENYKDKYDFVVINCENPYNKTLVEEYHIMGFPSLFIYDKKIDHKFALNQAVIIENSLLENELNNYLSVREKLIK